jgi:capsular polysaccharide biosynthesis protein
VQLVDIDQGFVANGPRENLSLRIPQPEKNGLAKHAPAVLTESKFTEDPEPGRTMSLRDLFRTIRKWLWVVALVTAILVAAVVWFSRMQAPTYEASMVILIGQNNGVIQNPGDATGLKEVTRTMSEAATGRPIAEGVVQQLNLQMSPDDIIANLKAEQVGETQFVKVTYTDSSPQRAQEVVNGVGEAFSAQVADLQSETADNAALSAEAAQQAGALGVPASPVVTATVWEQAEMPTAPTSPNPSRDGLLALGIGLMLGLGIAFLLEHLSKADRWRAPDEVEQVSGVPTLGVIPK